MIPYVFSQNNSAVSYKDCKFANEREKDTTARLVVFKELLVCTSFTLESTFYGCDAYKETPSFAKPMKGAIKTSVTANIQAAIDRDGIHITTDDLCGVGKSFCDTILAIVKSKVLKKKFLKEDQLVIKAQPEV